MYNHTNIIAQHTDISDTVRFTTYDSIVTKKDTLSSKLLLLLLERLLLLAAANSSSSWC